MIEVSSAIGIGLHRRAAAGGTPTPTPTPAPSITGTPPDMVTGAPYDFQFTVVPSGTAFSFDAPFAAFLAAHSIAHDGLGRLTSGSVT